MVFQRVAYLPPTATMQAHLRYRHDHARQPVAEIAQNVLKK